MSKYSNLGNNFVSDSFDYDKDRKVMAAELSTLRLDRFPKRLYVFSTKTGRTLGFAYDEQAAIQNEFWDGQLMYYKPLDTDQVNVEKLVLFND